MRRLCDEGVRSYLGRSRLTPERATLMGKLAGRIADKRMLGLIRRYLGAGVMVNGVAMERHEGTPLKR